MAFEEPIIVSKSLPTIHLDLLRAEVSTESQKLLNACRNQGFFYLDLTSDPELCDLWNGILERMEHYFQQPLEVKMQDDRGSDNYGYVPVGTEAGSTPGTKDGYETLKFSRREFLKGSADLTTSVRSESEYFFSFIKQAQAITLMILSHLSSQLGLTGSSRFEPHHTGPDPSLSTLVLLHYPKHEETATPTNVGHLKHTDVSSLTFLLTKQWGLQFLSPETKRWEFLEPRPGHAIVNVGDYLRFMSGGELASIVHRVVPLRERQEEERYSIAYFMRINDHVEFTDSTGKTWTAKEWHDFKFDVFKSPSLDARGQFLTGMMEETDK